MAPAEQDRLDGTLWLAARDCLLACGETTLSRNTTVLADDAGQVASMRALALVLFQSPDRLWPDAQAGTIEVRLPHFPIHAQSVAVAPLLARLNATATLYAGISLHLHYVLEGTSGRTETSHKSTLEPDPRLDS